MDLEDYIEDDESKFKMVFRITKIDNRERNIIRTLKSIDRVQLFSDWGESYNIKDIKEKISILNSDNQITAIFSDSNYFDHLEGFKDHLMDKTRIDSDLWLLIYNKIMDKNLTLQEKGWLGFLDYQIAIYFEEIIPNIHDNDRIGNLYVSEFKYKIRQSRYQWLAPKFIRAKTYYSRFDIF